LLTAVFQKKYLGLGKALLIFVVLCIALLILKLFAGYFLQRPVESITVFLKRFPNYLKGTFFRGMFFVMLATFYWAASHISYFRKQAHESEKRRLVAQNEKLEAEAKLAESRNAYLTQQLNPHLLFNSLNFIYNSVYQQSPEASNCVLLLSDIMRFSLEDAGQDGKVPLEDEIQQVKNLIAINLYRFNGTLLLETKFDLAAGPYRIIPLILLTLTENLFKHGNLKNAGQPALLQIALNEDGQLSYYSRNLKKAESGHIQRRQIGLQNTRIRLDYAYPGNYELKVTEDGECYELWLNLQL
jgi:LytS/YehU family sensor histidine kinase